MIFLPGLMAEWLEIGIPSREGLGCKEWGEGWVHGTQWQFGQ